VHHCDVPVVVLHKPKAAQQQQQQQRGQGDVAWLLSATAEDLAGRAGAAAEQQPGQEAVSFILGCFIIALRFISCICMVMKDTTGIAKAAVGQGCCGVLMVSTCSCISSASLNGCAAASRHDAWYLQDNLKQQQPAGLCCFSNSSMRLCNFSNSSIRLGQNSGLALMQRLAAVAALFDAAAGAPHCCCC
jgi:hypothetical protein